VIELITKLISYGWNILTGLVFWLFMHVLNRTTIIGRENLPKSKNRLIIANHLTMIDSWLISMACVWPQAIWKPYLIPWHLPEEKNFMASQPLKLMCQLWRCIPIHRGSGDFLRKLDQLKTTLQSGSLMIFPEGTRSREPKSGILYNWTRGAAILAHYSKATVVPVAIRGAEDILPIGSYWPRIGKRIVIVIGQPVELSRLYQKHLEEAEEIISEVMKARLQYLLTSASLLLNKKA